MNPVTTLKPIGARALLARGLAQSHAGALTSIPALSAARDAAIAERDDAVATLAAAALVVSGHALGNYRHLCDYHGELAPVRDGVIAFDDANEELLAHAGLLCALLMFGQTDPAIDRCVGRLLPLLERELDVNLRFAAARLVLYYTEPREQSELGRRVYAILQSSFDDPRLTAHRLGRLLIVWVRYASDSKDPALARRALEQAHATAERTHDPELAAWLAASEVEHGLRERDFARIERALAKIERIADPASLQDTGRLAWLKGRYALARGEGDAALFHVRRARRVAEVGRFEVKLDGAPIGVHGKAQKKPLELLKALIAGGGRAVDKARLADFLWPDADGDAALDMTISRLRKLLGRADALRIEDGKLGLDPQRVWVALGRNRGAVPVDLRPLKRDAVRSRWRKPNRDPLAIG